VTIQDEYQPTVIAAALCAKMLAQYDLRGVLDAIERAEATGSLFHPSLWMEKRRRAMAEDKALLEAALPLWVLGRKLKERPCES
jgi:hypothetical protein